MKCPKCQSPLVAFDSMEGVTVDFCSACGGSWFDSSEMSFYFETSDDVPLLQDALKSAQPGTHACPKCPSQTLLSIHYLPGEDLELDACPNCLGIWLDRGEIGKCEKLVAKRKMTRLGKIVKTLSDRGYTIIGGSAKPRS